MSHSSTSKVRASRRSPSPIPRSSKRAARVLPQYYSLMCLVAALSSTCAVLEVELEHLLEDHAHWLLFFDDKPFEPLLQRTTNSDVVVLLGLIQRRGHFGLS